MGATGAYLVYSTPLYRTMFYTSGKPSFGGSIYLDGHLLVSIGLGEAHK